MTSTETKKVEEIEKIMLASSISMTGFRFSDHRVDAYIHLSMVLVAVLLLFSLWHFYIDKIVLSLICMVIAVLFLSNIVMMKFTRRLLFPPLLTSLILISGVLVVISMLGQPAVFWAYPVICIFFSIHERKVASALTLLFLVVMAALVINVLNIDMLIRFYVTLMFTGLFANMMVRVIEQQQKSLQKLVITDPLTGALNRRCLDAALNHARECHQRSKSHETVLMMDIDHFKDINDSYGHEVGNEVLVDVVDLIKSRLRLLDMFFRYGGDEFIILLYETSVTAAGKLAEELRKLIENNKSSNDVKITISIGLAEIKENETTEEWVSRCDHALYEAKQNGRNQIMIAE